MKISIESLHAIADALPASEADMVVVSISAECVVVVYPFWEFDGNPAQQAAACALAAAEQFGHGPFYAVYRDRRIVTG